MDKVQFVYETYISTTPEMLWNALIDPKVRPSIGSVKTCPTGILDPDGSIGASIKNTVSIGRRGR